MKTTLLTSTLRNIFVSSIIFLFTLLPQVTQAADVDLNWGKDAKYEWVEEKGALKITFKFWDGNKNDDWLDNITISFQDKVILQATGNREGESWSYHELNITNECSIGKVYADAYDTSKSSTIWKDITNYTGKIAWKASGKVNSDSNEGHAVIYFYPHDKYMNKKGVLHLKAKVRDSGVMDNEHDYDSKNTVSTTALSYALEEVIFEGWKSNGQYPLTVKNLTNGNAYQKTRSTIKLETSLDRKNWYTQASHVINNTQEFVHTFSDAKYIKYPKNTKDTIGYKQFAEGIYFRVLAETDPDTSSGDYLQLYTSQSEKTPPIAVLANNQLTVNHTIDNELYFVWNVYKPSVSGTISNNWVIEEKQASGSWEEIASMECKNGKNSYTHQLAISHERKEVTKHYRVRNTAFNAGYWFEYLSTDSKNPIKYHPYYQTFQPNSLKATPISSDRSATISWERTSNGIWNEDISLRLEYQEQSSSDVKTKSLNYSDKSYTLQGLKECTGYYVTIIASNSKEGYMDSIRTYFSMPDAGNHKISNFEATRGYYTNKVRLRWDVEKGNTFNHFEITRREIGETTEVSVAELSFNANNTVYSYEDMDVEAGTIYEYKVIGYTDCDMNEQQSHVTAAAPSCYGFSQAYASVSGRIYFNGDQGVPGVDVAVTGSEEYVENYSLEFNGSNSYLCLPEDVIDFRNDNSITFQAYINPREQKVDTAYICTHKGIFELALVKLSNNKQYALINNLFSKTHIDTLETDEWHHLTMAIHVDKGAKSVTANYYSNGVLKYSQSHKNVDFSAIELARDTAFIVGAYSNLTKNFKGNIDEIRVWNAVLDSAYVRKSYNRYISGREANLRAYYRCNEPGVDVVFDYSGKSDQFNKRDGDLSSTVCHSDKIVPASEQLANKAITDEDGNYIINTVPYTTEGQQYEVVPMLGVHQFSPSKQPIYVSSSSTVFNKIDFTDKSSFEVSGTVYYENSNYPVANCQLKIDGVLCTNNGTPVLTNSAGEFTINVPIGEHYIEIVKDGHEFAYGGRYPIDSLGQNLLHNFQKPISNLRFTDVTKANLVGRIAGGEVEYSKKYGGRHSVANMGQAKIVLRASDLYSLNMRDSVKETSTSFVENTVELPCDSIHPDIQSSAFIGKGSHGNLVTIYTDAQTGEFGVKLPPLQYEVDSIIIPSNPSIVFDMESIKDIDLRDVTTINIDTAIYQIDSTLIDLRTVSYVDDLKVLYRSEPTFNVTQRNRVDGSFGESQYIYTDELTGKDEAIALYTNTSDGIAYMFDYPIFEQLEEYTFNLLGYEEYVNYDIADEPRRDTVALENTLVTIANEFGVEQAVDTATGKLWDDLEEGQLYLDSLGQAEYTFMVGFPNLAAPYTYSVSIKYNVDGKEYLWQEKPLEAIILGNIPGGNQFVTGGPDMVTMILRDPPGSHSSSYFESGSKSVTSQSWNWSAKLGLGLTFSKKKRVTLTSFSGTFTGMGGGMINGRVTQQFSAGHDRDHTIGGEVQYKGNKTYTTTTVLNKRVSTSPTVGYIGAAGDIFIGCATNLLLGEAREVMITRDTLGEYHIGLEDVITAGEKFTTTFHYSQTYILSSLLPNLRELRNSFLITGDTTANIPAPKIDPIYVTPLTPDHPKFGKDSTYKVIYPENVSNELAQADTISVINAQIKAWEGWLRVNEQEKVLAIERLAYNDDNTSNEGVEVNDSTTANFVKKNYSFDSGTSITDIIQNVKDTSLTHGGDFGINYKFNILFTGKLRKQAWNIGLSLNPAVGTSGTGTEISGTTTTTGFTLADQDLNNAYTVDVITSNMSGRSAVFYTRGGQTSCPCAIEERTLFYEPGKYKLAEATVQIEVPQIRVEQPFATDVPTGEAARFTIIMDNLSETNTDLVFDLCVLDESNPNGARIAMDGEGLVGNRPIRIKSGETMVKEILLRQTDLGVLDYKNIQLVLKSQCQGGLAFSKIIADTVAISASFTPSCSNIELEIANSILNTSTGAQLPITIKGYNMQYSNLKGIRLQYKGEGDTDWTMINEWLIDPALNTDADTLTTGEINYTFDMSDNAITPDGTYQFRAITICNYGTGEIHNESEVIEVVKDLNRPMVFGTPLPSNGILSASGEISVTFNEDIKSSALTETRNFVVEGRLNGYKVDHAVAMQLTEGALAETTTDMQFTTNPFSINMWINYAKAGHVIRFGNATNRLAIAINDMGQLTVTMADNTLTSTNSIPHNQWVFLALAYDTVGGGTITADYITDATSVNLFDHATIGMCKSVKSKLVLGGDLTAAIHELTIWSYARSIEEAQSEIYVAKSASTPYLVAYWHMDEGAGNIAEDVVQGHHIVLPSTNTWYLENENWAAQLDGKTALQMDMSRVSPSTDEDYLLEMWFNAADQQLGTLLSNGLGFYVGYTDNGVLQVQGKTLAVTPNIWNHLAINHRVNGATTIYINGEEVMQIAKSVMPALAADHLVIGADRYLANKNTSQWSYRNYFIGSIDEVRLWKATLTAEYIRQQYRQRIYGDEAGLVAYYPFEKTVLNEANQPEVQFDLVDHSTYQAGELAVVGGTMQNMATEQTPPLKSISLLENVSYSYVASERKIVIQLNEQAERLEGTKIFFTVQNVQDMHGNLSNPVTWTALVHQNQLKWLKKSHELEIESNLSAEFETTIVNRSAENEHWQLQNMPTWLRADKEYGELSGMSSETLVFTVSETVPIGTYEETIYLVGKNGIYEPLIVRVVVTGKKPNWHLDTDQDEYSMNVIGQLKIEETISEDTQDMIAAFVDNKCVGIASPQYSQRYDKYFVMMDIYSSKPQASITFKVYDASTGNTYPIVEVLDMLDEEPKTSLAFENGKLIGSQNTPLIWDAKDYLEQVVDFNSNWNWLSLYVNPTDTLASRLLNPIMPYMVVLKNKVSSMIFENGRFVGKDMIIRAAEKYRTKLSEKKRHTFIGRPVDIANTPITIAPKWNWIGYPASFNMSVTDAFAGLNPKDGDIVKSKSSFATYSGYEWIGTLTTLVPGQGYEYYSNEDKAKTFTFPAQTTTRHLPIRKASRASGTFTPVEDNRYPSNMTVVAKVYDGNELQLNAEVAAFVGEECRGVATSDENGFVCLTIAGESAGDRISFKVLVGNEIHTVKETITYEDDAIVGSISQAYLIQLDATTELENTIISSAHVYAYDGVLHVEGATEDYKVFDILGRIMYQGMASQVHLSNGVYLVQLGEETQQVVL